MVQPGSRILPIITELKREVLTLQKFDGKFTVFWSIVAGRRAKKKYLSLLLACITASSSNCCHDFYRHQGTDVKDKKKIRKAMKINYRSFLSIPLTVQLCTNSHTVLNHVTRRILQSLDKDSW